MTYFACNNNSNNEINRTIQGNLPGSILQDRKEMVRKFINMSVQCAKTSLLKIWRQEQKRNVSLKTKTVPIVVGTIWAYPLPCDELDVSLHERESLRNIIDGYRDGQFYV